MKVAVLFSGGKDSSLALLWALNSKLNVRALVSVISSRDDSYMFHVPNIALTELQAKAAHLPYVKVFSSGLNEEELLDLKRALEGLNVDAVVSGTIASEYQREHLEAVCAELGLKNFTPLWHLNETVLLLNLVNLGFDVRFSGVYAMGFTRSWLGRRLDYNAIADLILLRKKYGINIAGEGGEYETIVLDAPFFKERIKIVECEAYWDGYRGQVLIRKAELMKKRRMEN